MHLTVAVDLVLAARDKVEKARAAHDEVCSNSSKQGDEFIAETDPAWEVLNAALEELDEALTELAEARKAHG